MTAGNGDYSLMDGNYDDGSWAYQTKTGIKTYEDLYNAGLGRYNSLYEHLAVGDDGLFVTNASGNYLTERYTMANGSYWPKTTDNFWQSHNILSAAFQWGDHWTATASLHYTHGYGYYREFRYKNKPKNFGINDTDVSKTDFVRKKGLEQDAFGGVACVNYRDQKWDVVGGLSVQQFSGNHFGYLTYVKDQGLSNRLLANGDYKYYDSDAKKLDANAYVKAAYNLSELWKVFVDVQYRHVDYTTDGINDKFYDNNGRWYNQALNIDETYNFFNPKAGISFSPDRHHFFASVAMSHREPERNNFTDNYKYPFPKAEQMVDIEAGYNYASREVRLGANLYYMSYKDQFVQTGELSEIGEPLTTNIDKSYRMGIELSAAWDICELLTVEGNAALSQNKLKDFTEMASVDWDDAFRPIHYDNTTLAFSPAAILNGFIDFHYRGFQATWHTNFVSRQYLDNTENKDRSLPAYTFSNLAMSYTLKSAIIKPLKEVVVGVQFNNVFNAHYATSGWVYSSILEDYGHPNENRYYQIGFIPMAPATAMANVTLRF